MSKIFFTIIVVLVVITMFVGSELKKSNGGAGVTDFDIYNFTNSAFAWNSSSFPVTEINSSIDGVGRVNNLVAAGINWVGFSLFEVCKWGVGDGYRNEEHDFLFYVYFVKWVLVIFVFLSVLPVLLPLIILAYFVFVFFRWLLVRHVFFKGCRRK